MKKGLTHMGRGLAVPPKFACAPMGVKPLIPDNVG